MTRLPRICSAFGCAIATLCAVSLNAADWQLIDKFDGGEPQAEWTSVGTPVFDFSANSLKLTLAPGSNSTSTATVLFPQAFSTGKFTVTFDLYLPAGALQNQVGFGVGSASQRATTGWGPIGNRNRFQTVSTNIPQNLTKVPIWDGDVMGTTAQGTWYNIWLVYDLDADPKTVTAYTKRAVDGMETVLATPFTFDGTDNDDWSAVDHFGVGIGAMDLTPLPAGVTPADSLGGIFDNIYVAAGENLTLSPTAIAPAWTLIDDFAGGAPRADWGGDLDDLDIAFTGDALSVKGKAGKSRVRMHTALPQTVTSGNFTVAFELTLPGPTTSPNHALFSVVGGTQLAASDALQRLGGNDFFLTFGSTPPQKLTKYTQWTADLLNPTVQEQTYQIWLVYDTDALTVDFYAAPLGGDLPAAPSASYALASSYTDFSHVQFGAFMGGGTGMKVDNIFFAPAKLITVPEGSGPLPIEPCGTTIFAGAPGWKDTHLGSLDDSYYPFVWLNSIQSWAWIIACGANGDSPGNGYYFLDITGDDWGYIDSDWNGWLYIFTGGGEWVYEPAFGM